MRILEQIKNKDFDVIRIVLLSQSFSFNLDIDSFKKIKKEDEKEQALRGLLFEYHLPKDFILGYAKSRKLDIENLETQLCVYEVYDRASDGERNVIDQDGLYIKFDPGKTDRFYKRVIKRLRSAYEFQNASEDKKRNFIKEGGKSPYLYNFHKKALQKRHQQGSDFDKKIKTYLVCEKSFTEMNRVMSDTSFSKSDDINDRDTSMFVEKGLEFAAERLKMKPQKVKNIYYEVCRRYGLPTIKKNPFPVPLDA